jgi:hypothetical protein
MRRRISTFALAIGLMTSCAGAGSTDGSSAGTSTADDDAGDAAEADGDSLGSDGADLPHGCAEPCDSPPSSCYEPVGSCVGSTCEYTPFIAGTSCGDPCGGAGVCDAMGTCLGGSGGGCDRPNTTGGTCGASGCDGWSCVTGFENCNGDWADGCETDLEDPETCGDCNTTCTAGPNATATCTAGACDQTCTGDFENCDGDWGNGCEVPTGVPNQCSGAGLDPVDGCWTAWCGTSSSPDATNFGTYHCVHCANCNTPSAGNWRWCSSASGTWFPQEPGTCASSSEDLVCSP